MLHSKWLMKPRVFLLLIPLISFLLYGNTISHKYAQDDAIVIYDNQYTVKGLDGIPDLLKYDTFKGFFKSDDKALLVSGGRYRPLTPIMFAIEYELFHENPHISHLINLLLYAFLGLMIYAIMVLVLTNRIDKNTTQFLAFITALLFIAHPVHTEVVANIKGRDEIMAMLFSVIAFWASIKYTQKHKIHFLILIFVAFFLGLLSKENTITFIGVWVLYVLLFKPQKRVSSLAPLSCMIVAGILFIWIRIEVIGLSFGEKSLELMNNPFLIFNGSSYIHMGLTEKYATIVYTLMQYLKLLIFPHPLTHDYYPQHIAMMSWSDVKVIISMGLHIFLVSYAVFQYKKRPFLTFSIIYYFITLSIVSNILFPIGTHMSERFLFMPSLGFIILLTLLFYKIYEHYGKKWSTVLLSIIFIGYSFKTISRNNVWKDDYTLFTTDVHTSINSAKVLNAAGGALVNRAAKEKNEKLKNDLLDEAIEYLNKSLSLHPTYKSPALILGNAYFYKDSLNKSIHFFEKVLEVSPSHIDAQKNLAIVLRQAGKKYGEIDNDIDKALRYLNRSYSLNSTDVETLRLLGVANGVAGNHQEAIKYFEIVSQKHPNKTTFENLAKAYANSGNIERAQYYLQKSQAFK